MMSTPLACESFLREAAETVGCTLWSAYNTPGRSRHVTVLIDKENGATGEDCERVMDQLQFTYAKLDSYLNVCDIDVATPGLDRVLHTIEHYTQSLHKLIEVKGTHNLTEDNKKNLRGYLIACDSKGITLECSKDKVYSIPYSAIAKCRWIFNTTTANREKT